MVLASGRRLQVLATNSLDDGFDASPVLSRKEMPQGLPAPLQARERVAPRASVPRLRSEAEGERVGPAITPWHGRFSEQRVDEGAAPEPPRNTKPSRKTTRRIGGSHTSCSASGNSNTRLPDPAASPRELILECHAMPPSQN
jgi:hypothetical protein